LANVTDMKARIRTTTDLRRARSTDAQLDDSFVVRETE
jgi:hypothetical protein